MYRVLSYNYIQTKNNKAMGKNVTLYELFQMRNLLSDNDLLRIGKTKNIDKIIIVYDSYPYEDKIKSIQVIHNEIFMNEYYPKYSENNVTN